MASYAAGGTTKLKTTKLITVQEAIKLSITIQINQQKNKNS
jgi:hypothetical protein